MTPFVCDLALFTLFLSLVPTTLFKSFSQVVGCEKSVEALFFKFLRGLGLHFEMCVSI